VIDTSVIIKTGIFDHGELKEKYAEKSIIFHKALGKKTKLEVQPVKKYSGKGAQTLVDGMTGSARYNDGYWLGFDGTDLDFTVDMEEEVPVQQVTVNFYQRQSFWIFMPVEVIIQVLDESGKIAASQTVLPKTDPKSEETVIEAFKVKFDHVKGQYVRVVGKNCGNCPAWHKGAGDTCWIFSDEVIVK